MTNLVPAQASGQAIFLWPAIFESYKQLLKTDILLRLYLILNNLLKHTNREIYNALLVNLEKKQLDQA